MVTNPQGNAETRRCTEWLAGLLRAGVSVKLPEIADYELRRELLRANLQQGIRRLDHLKSALGYVPLTTEAVLTAAEFWARARNMGRPTADDKALDVDMILSGQAALIRAADTETIVATTNVGHLALFCEARLWRDIWV